MAGFGSWKDFYASDLQGAAAPIVVPALFLLWLLLGRGAAARSGAEPEAAPFVRRYALWFGILTILDPLCTGPLLRASGLEGPAATAVPLLFVALGDWRVYLLLFGLRNGSRPFAPVAWRAAAWTLAVPVFAWPAYRVLVATAPGLPEQTLWLLYEWAFAGLALVLRHALLSDRALESRPAVRTYLRGALAYAATYYALWAAADALVLGAGWDAGWALRVLPNQLYYAFWVPFVYFAFFSERSVSRRSGIQAAQ